MLDPPTFIATARLDDESSRLLDGLRKRYFPPDRNFLDAHVTLFHQLSVEASTTLERAVREGAPGPFEVALAAPFPLGRGVAIRIGSPRLVALRDRLAARLVGDLTPQDRQPYRPHVTIQNKVSKEEARATLDLVRREWVPGAARVEGIDLWEYLGGPWRPHARLDFPSPPAGP